MNSQHQEFLNKIVQFEYFICSFLKNIQIKFNVFEFEKEVDDYVYRHNEIIEDDDEIEEDDKEDYFIGLRDEVSNILNSRYSDSDIDYKEFFYVESFNNFILKQEKDVLIRAFQNINGKNKILYTNEFYELIDRLDFILASTFVDLNYIEDVFNFSHKIKYDTEKEKYDFSYELNDDNAITTLKRLKEYLVLAIDRDREN